jgi:hypothetical protein
MSAGSAWGKRLVGGLKGKQRLLVLGIAVIFGVGVLGGVYGLGIGQDSGGTPTHANETTTGTDAQEAIRAEQKSGAADETKRAAVAGQTTSGTDGDATVQSTVESSSGTGDDSHAAGGTGSSGDGASNYGGSSEYWTPNPADRSANDESASTPEPTATPRSTTTPTQTTTVRPTPTPTPQPPTFRMDATRKGKCGSRCYVVSAYIKNTGDEVARDVSVDFTLRTGNHVLHQGTEQIGRLEPGEKYQTETKLNLGLADVWALQNNDCVLDSEAVVHHSTGQDQTLTKTRDMDCSL